MKLSQVKMVLEVIKEEIIKAYHTNKDNPYFTSIGFATAHNVIANSSNTSMINQKIDDEFDIEEKCREILQYVRNKYQIDERSQQNNDIKKSYKSNENKKIAAFVSQLKQDLKKDKNTNIDDIKIYKLINMGLYRYKHQETASNLSKYQTENQENDFNEYDNQLLDYIDQKIMTALILSEHQNQLLCHVLQNMGLSQQDYAKIVLNHLKDNNCIRFLSPYISNDSLQRYGNGIEGILSSPEHEKTIAICQTIEAELNDICEEFNEFNPTVKTPFKLEERDKRILAQSIYIAISQIGYLLSLPHTNSYGDAYSNSNDKANNSSASYAYASAVHYYDITSSGDKLSKQIKTTTSIGKYYQRILGVDTSTAKARHAINRHKAKHGEISLNFAANNDVDTWLTVYQSPHISSCMSKDETVESIRSYAISSDYWADEQGNRLPDNHLRLYYLNTPEQAEARAIVNMETKTYVSAYGDTETIEYLLNKHGFLQDDFTLEGVKIAIVASKDNNDNTLFFGPSVDGDAYFGNRVDKEYATYNNKHAQIVELSSNDNSDFTLRHPNARVMDNHEEYCCTCCMNIYNLDDNPTPLYEVLEDGEVEERARYVCNDEVCQEQVTKAFYGYEELFIYNLEEALDCGYIISTGNDPYYYVNNEETILAHNLVFSNRDGCYYNADYADVVYLEDEDDYTLKDNINTNTIDNEEKQKLKYI